MTTDSEPALRWLIYAQDNDRFPFRLLIEQKPGHFLAFDVQDKWPGPGRSVFCIARPGMEEADLPGGVEPVDACFVKTIQTFGRKLTVILDRKTRKRSWFISVERASKTKPGKVYQQTFWITQSSASARRGGAYLSRRGKDSDLAIVRDARERYGYRFPDHQVEEIELEAGDYALKNERGEVIAAVERKTREQFLADIATLEVIKARLLEMATRYRHSAMVIETDYARLVDPKKSRFYSAGLVADVIAELHAGFPSVQIVFCSNRKFAREWVERYFTRIARLEQPPETTGDRP